MRDRGRRRHGSLRFNSSRKLTRKVKCRLVLPVPSATASDAARLLPLGAISIGHVTATQLNLLFRPLARLAGHERLPADGMGKKVPGSALG